MNKTELAEAVADRAGLGKAEAAAAVTAVLEALVEATTRGDKVALTGFGTFAPTSRPARAGRNPATGEAIQIAASNGVKFTPGGTFKTALNPEPKATKGKGKAKKG